jgi:TolB-like protein/Flp pilus assembly protein TadD
MGEVYRATDTKLGRDVALKVLPAEMAASPERRERFRREAQALAALDHPGIVTVHSVEEADGVHFLTMQLVEGQPLDRLIPEAGLPIERLARIASSLAEALAAAHAKGIVHRDLKPGNVMLGEDDRVKVLDFGLAKMPGALPGEGSGSELPTEMRTREGVVVGTVPYMSPEQVQGRAVDERTDIFSLGAVLYEMATGRRPFRSDNAAGLMSAILRDTPRPPGELRAGLPADFDRIVGRCLEKDARDRPARAHEVHEALEAVRRGLESGAIRSTGGAPTPAEHPAPLSIAVLPFSDMSPARDHDWFCEGIAEEILNALTRLPGLRVATRTSAFRFKDPARDIGRIGETLGVTTLLEGSVRTAGSRLRVTAQLVNASDGYQLWSERFDRQMEDVFEIQDEIARRVVEALELRLAAPPLPRGEARHSDDLEAYHLFLQGRHFRYSKLDLRSALRSFEQAVERDPSYALARVGLAETLVVLLIYGMIPSSAGQARAKEELRRAGELAGESAQGRGVAALLALVCDWDTRAALEGFERALELDPISIPVRAWYTWALLAAGRTAEAVEQARRIVQLDPQSPYANAMAGLTQLMAGRVDEAVTLERQAVEIEPQSLQANYMLGLALAGASEWEEATEWFRHAFDRSSRAPFFLGLLAWGQAASGRGDEARLTLGELEGRAATEYVSPLFRAWATSELGDAEQTRTLLADAFTERASLLVLPGIPCLRKLRSEPRMKELAQRLLDSAGLEAPR